MLQSKNVEGNLSLKFVTCLSQQIRVNISILVNLHYKHVNCLPTRLLIMELEVINNVAKVTLSVFVI
jgi:hypothetical protein